MKKFMILLCGIFIAMNVQALQLYSPDRNIEITFDIGLFGTPFYEVSYKGDSVIETSMLGFEIKNSSDLNTKFEILSYETSSFDETWQPVWGEYKEIRNHYNELIVNLTQPKLSNRKLTIYFRAYNDGVAFRYEFPLQPNLSYFIIDKENTEFNLTGNHTAFWIPGDYDTNEYAYTTSKLSEVHAQKGLTVSEIGTRTIIADNAVQTPLMMKTDDGLYINLHEAALVNYPVMHILIDKEKSILEVELVPDAVGNFAYIQTPFKTPWRTIIISDKAEDILASNLILNVNDPCNIEDTSWIYPQKYIGIWWELHVGKHSWNYADVGNVKLDETDWESLTPNGRHGATTENTKRYIDFAEEHGFNGVLVEGWDIGWEDWYGKWKEEVFDFVTPYPDFDVEALQAYAAEKGVKLIMHHETSSSVTNYERRMHDAYGFMKKHGYDTVKTGYVGRIIPRGEYHDGQWMMNHYVHVAKQTAKNKIMVNSHESCRPTGLHRTYPNWLACEAARGNEFNAWSAGNPPDHETILPFTRLMGGPMDYTPGIFQIKMDYYKPGSQEQVHTTLVKQLALYVTMYSPLQMAADLPENYERFLDAFQFIRDVPVDWDDTKIIEAEPGDYVTIARKAKDRDEWFIGAITDENARSSEIPLDFLKSNQWYVATLYLDGRDAHWKDNPMSYKIAKAIVNNETVLNLSLAEGGGAAVSITPAHYQDLKKYQKYD
ncbi:MAG: glycoside hydrolase family 97 protein [Candidatus Cloacimonetes bacterium]|nr:glycoside hydrolase family 97 protein [Candidatus Cloacimonadota bacterium]